MTLLRRRIDRRFIRSDIMSSTNVCPFLLVGLGLFLSISASLVNWVLAVSDDVEECVHGGVASIRVRLTFKT